jgi:iron(III) transport system ATP-binding protein
LRAGRLLQVGTPRAVYGAPVDLGVATFVGEAVVLPAVVTDGVAESALGRYPVRGLVAQGPVYVMVRPEQLAIEAHPTKGGIPARVVETRYYGPYASVQLVLCDGETRVTARVMGDDTPEPDTHVCLIVRGEVRAYAREA